MFRGRQPFIFLKFITVQTVGIVIEAGDRLSEMSGIFHFQ